MHSTAACTTPNRPWTQRESRTRPTHPGRRPDHQPGQQRHVELRRSPKHSGVGADQVRSANRWRIAAIDPATNRLAAERLSDGARTVFGDSYLTEHVTLGYATTVHAAQGVTADSCYAILGEGAHGQCSTSR